MTRIPRPAVLVSLMLTAGLALSACGSDDNLAAADAAADAAPVAHAMAGHSSSS